MSKKFYVVKNETDPMTGGVIPYKVNYFPSGFGPQFIQPMPITKSTGISIPLESPFVSSPMPNYFPGLGPQVNLTGKPFKPQVIGMSSSIFSPYSPQVVNPFGQQLNTYGPQMNTTFGAPIVKYGPLLQQKIPGLIKLVIGGNVISVSVPFNYFRNVVNDIYARAYTNINPADPKIKIQLISPSLNTTIDTSYTNMMKIIKYIENTYGNIGYNYNGMNFNYADLRQKLYVPI